MSTNRIEWTGLQELKDEMRKFPEQVTAEAGTIVTAHAEGAQAEIKATYDLQIGRDNELSAKTTIGKGVSVGRFSASVIVKNNSPLAWIYENGTEARHTALGHNRGAMPRSMPPAHVFLPRVIRWRKRMYQALSELLQRNGLTVSGEP